MPLYTLGDEARVLSWCSWVSPKRVSQQLRPVRNHLQILRTVPARFCDVPGPILSLQVKLPTKTTFNRHVHGFQKAVFG